MIWEFVKGVLVLAACIPLYILILKTLGSSIFVFLTSVISLIKIFEVGVISAIMGIGAASLLKTYCYSGGFRYYIPVGILLFLVLGCGILKVSTFDFVSYLTTISNILLGGGMGIFVGSCIVSGFLESRYDPIPIWMYALTYGGSIAVVLALYRISYATRRYPM